MLRHFALRQVRAASTLGDVQCPLCSSVVPDRAVSCPVCGNPLSSQTLPVGTLLQGKYRIDKVLGQGGFGITYAVTQVLLGARFAIKEMFPNGTVRQGHTVHPPTTFDLAGWQQAKQGFTEEARVLARFNHPDIVRVLDLFEEGGTAYMVMEHLEGETLQDRLNREGALPVAEVGAIALRVAQALKLVHDAGLLHRDIKPDNIFLEASGRIVLIDFGSARTFESGKTMQHTRMVTPGYAPMEQYGSAMKFGPYTDIYALGATLYHALSGRMPPAAPDLLQGTALPPLPSSVPPELRRAVEQAMAPKIADRPQGADEFMRLLAQTARPAPRPVPSPAPAPRMPSPQAPAPQPVPPAPPAPRRRGSAWPLIALAALGFGALKHFSGAGQSRTATASSETASESAPPAETTTPQADIPQAPATPQTDTTPAPEPEVMSTPLTITSPLPYDTLPPQGFDLQGHGQPADVVDIMEDGTSLGRIQVSDDGRWSFHVGSPTVGPHTYELRDKSGTAVQTRAINIARTEAAAPEEQILDEEVQALVDTYMQYGGGDDVAPAMNLYAERVDYFNRGFQPKVALYEDKRNYFKRWPQRRYERVSDITTLSEQGQARQVRFDYRYDITRPDKEISGTAYTVLDLAKMDGELKITGEKGAIYPETQVKRVLMPAGEEATPDVPTTASGEAPKFMEWHFGDCGDDETGRVATGLTRGRLQYCPLVINTVPNGAQPVQAEFNYELEYPDEYGTTQKFAIDAPDHWPPAPDQPTTKFRQDGDNLIFILPLIVKDRADRPYNSINVTGEIIFDNGSRKKVYEKLPVQ